MVILSHFVYANAYAQDCAALGEFTEEAYEAEDGVIREHAEPKLDLLLAIARAKKYEAGEAKEIVLYSCVAVYGEVSNG